MVVCPRTLHLYSLFLCLSKSTKKAILSEIQGALLPRPPPGLYPGPTGELTATPRPPAEFSNDLWSLHVVPTAQLPQDWEFFLFSHWNWDFGLFQCWELGSETLLQDPLKIVTFTDVICVLISILKLPQESNTKASNLTSLQWF